MLLTSDINQLRSEVAVMARRAQEIFGQSIECLRQSDEAAVDRVREADVELDNMELTLDRQCMRLLLLKEPYALDFRFIFSTIKVTRELERVGDQAKTVARWSLKLKGVAADGMLELANKAAEALDMAVQALLDGDVERARTVMQLELQIDALEDALIENASGIPEAFIAKALERVGDLATNIAENVIFTVDATDIRHGQFENPRPI